MRRVWKAFSLGAILTAIVGGALSEMGKNGVNYAVSWLNDRVEITFKDPNAKKEVKEVAQAKPPTPIDSKERRSYYPDTSTNFYPDTYGYGDYYPAKPAGKRSDERSKSYSYDYFVPNKPAAKRANTTTEWVTTGYRDLSDPVISPTKPAGKRSNATGGWDTTSYTDYVRPVFYDTSYPAQNR